jgi:hypothetical protein
VVKPPVQNNKNPKPFVWTKGPEKLQRIIETTKEYQAAHQQTQEAASQGA